MPQLDHEQLDVYRIAIDFLVLANDMPEPEFAIQFHHPLYNHDAVAAAVANDAGYESAAGNNEHGRIGRKFLE